MTKTSFTIRDANLHKEREFVAGLWLGPKNHYGYTYRLIDLEVGDRVFLEYHRPDGVDTAETLCIHRRPGGRVPQTPGFLDDDPKAPHARARAWQDFEEKGIPLPPQFDPQNAPGLINGRPPPPGTVLIPARLVDPNFRPPVPPTPGPPAPTPPGR